jgi:hypothetical protein
LSVARNFYRIEPHSAGLDGKEINCDGGPKFYSPELSAIPKGAVNLFGMFFSLVIYLAIGLWLLPTPALSSEMKETVIFTKGFYFLSAAFIVLIFMLRKKIYHRPSLLPPSSQEVLKQISFYKMVRYLLIYVFCEAIGLFGLAHLLLMGSVQHFLNLMLVSIILMISLYPRKFADGN